MPAAVGRRTAGRHGDSLEQGYKIDSGMRGRAEFKRMAVTCRGCYGAGADGYAGDVEQGFVFEAAAAFYA